jgi:hypothetical protein
MRKKSADLFKEVSLIKLVLSQLRHDKTFRCVGDGGWKEFRQAQTNAAQHTHVRFIGDLESKTSVRGENRGPTEVQSPI